MYASTTLKISYAPYLRIQLPGRFMWRSDTHTPVGAVCGVRVRIELRVRAELYAYIQSIDKNGDVPDCAVPNNKFSSV